MAWVTLSLRKQTLLRDISELNMEDLRLSRSIRSVHRNLSYQQSVFENDKSKELRDAKAKYNEAKKNRPSVKDAEAYENWKVAYTQAQEDYQAQKVDIEDYYDDLAQQLEEEAKSKEDFFNDQRTQIESQRDAESAELEALKEEIKNEIKTEAISF